MLRVAFTAPLLTEYSIRLADALADRCETRVFIDGPWYAREETPHLERLAEARAVKLPFEPRRPWNKLAAILRLERRITQFRPDVIHAHEHPATTNVVLLERLARRFPVAVIVHDPEPHSGSDGEVARSRAGYYARGRSLASGLIVHGPYCRGALERRVPIGGRPVLTTKIGGEVLPEVMPDAPGEPGSFLMFGRMEAYKGLDVLLDAVKILATQDAPVRFTIAGRGESVDLLAAEFAPFAQCTVLNRFVPAVEAIELMRRHSAVLLPYKDATQSGVAGTAFGNGRPVIASRVGGLADSVEDGVNGLTIPPGDPRALAAAILRLADDVGLLERLSRGARETADRRSWRAVAAETAPFYDEVVRYARDVRGR